MNSENSPISSSFPGFSAVCWDEKPSTGHSVKSSASDVTEKIRIRKEIKSSRRRIVRACMRCRLRKTKCDGGSPCTRCTEADDVCEYIKCSKKEIKEYSQDYVQRLLEQNDKYKTAMRVLYANRRLSIQPDSMIIPSTESDDIPLVHDILDRLGLLGEPAEDLSTTTEFRSPPVQYKTIAKDLSISSVQSSLFNASIFDSHSSASLDSPVPFDMQPVPDFDGDMMGMDTDMGLNFPFQVYETMNASMTDKYSEFAPKLALDAQIDQQDWATMMMSPLFPVEGTWGVDGTNLHYTY